MEARITNQKTGRQPDAELGVFAPATPLRICGPVQVESSQRVSSHIKGAIER